MRALLAVLLLSACDLTTQAGAYASRIACHGNDDCPFWSNCGDAGHCTESSSRSNDMEPDDGCVDVAVSFVGDCVTTDQPLTLSLGCHDLSGPSVVVNRDVTCAVVTGTQGGIIRLNVDTTASVVAEPLGVDQASVFTGRLTACGEHVVCGSRITLAPGEDLWFLVKGIEVGPEGMRVRVRVEEP